MNFYRLALFIILIPSIAWNSWIHKYNTEFKLFIKMYHLHWISIDGFAILKRTDCNFSDKPHFGRATNGEWVFEGSAIFQVI